jgi:hypothetical protein
MLSTSGSRSAKAPIPLISCWAGLAPGMASKSGMKVTGDRCGVVAPIAGCVC